MTSFQYDGAIPAGSLVVVSGVNGFIASYAVDQLLLSGYRVRGTVRSRSKSAWTHDLFKGKYGDGSFELAEVPDMGAPGAFDQVVKGASGFVHVATPVMQSPDPNEAVPTVINGSLKYSHRRSNRAAAHACRHDVLVHSGNSTKAKRRVLVR